jgi:hypothetical protein
LRRRFVLLHSYLLFGAGRIPWPELKTDSHIRVPRTFAKFFDDNGPTIVAELCSEPESNRMQDELIEIFSKYYAMHEALSENRVFCLMMSRLTVMQIIIHKTELRRIARATTQGSMPELVSPDLPQPAASSTNASLFFRRRGWHWRHVRPPNATA